MSRKQQQQFIQAKDFEQKRFGVSPINVDIGNKNQYMAYSRYRYANLKTDRIPNFKFATGWVEMNQYGLPPPPGENSYTQSEEDRDHIRVPLDVDQEACVELGAMLKSMDETLATDDALQTILSSLPKYAGKPKSLAKACKKYMLVPSYRTPKASDEDEESDDEEEGDDKDKKKVKHDFCKMKIDRDWNTKNFTVSLFVGEKEEDFEPKTFSAKKVTVRNATELNEYVNFCCKVRLVVSVNKIWVSKSTGETGMYKYGLGMKIVQMQVIPRQGGQDSAANDFSQMAFIGAVPDDEEEEEEDDVVEEEAIEESDGEEEEDEEEVVEEEDEEEVVEDDDEEEDDDADDEEEVEYEEVEVEVEVSDEDEDEEEEEPEPPKKTTKKKKKKTKN